MTDDTTNTKAGGSPRLSEELGRLADAAEAWLFFCSRPGRRMVFASVDCSGSEAWPLDEWTHVQRVALVPAGERETLWDKRPNARLSGRQRP